MNFDILRKLDDLTTEAEQSVTYSRLMMNDIFNEHFLFCDASKHYIEILCSYEESQTRTEIAQDYIYKTKKLLEELTSIINEVLKEERVREENKKSL